MLGITVPLDFGIINSGPCSPTRYGAPPATSPPLALLPIWIDPPTAPVEPVNIPLPPPPTAPNNLLKNPPTPDPWNIAVAWAFNWILIRSEIMLRARSLKLNLPVWTKLSNAVSRFCVTDTNACSPNLAALEAFSV